MAFAPDCREDEPLPNADLSVVIPTYNGASMLPVTLHALEFQSLASDRFEVIIVDDGSSDNTESVFADLALPRSFRYVRQQNKGAAAARNRGASLANGGVLLFLDSDVIADANLAQEHLEYQNAHDRTLVVGCTRAWLGYEGDVFYRVMGEELFAFDLGDQETSIGFQEVVSRNLSLRRDHFFDVGIFDESFPRSGFEDTEFALRAASRGYRMVYNPKAAGDHRHMGNLTRVGEHMYNYQISAALLISRHPELRGRIRHLRDKEPVRLSHDDPVLLGRKAIRRIFSLAPCQWLLHQTIATLEKRYPEPSLLRKLYWQVLGDYLYRGFREGLRQYPQHAISTRAGI